MNKLNTTKLATLAFLVALLLSMLALMLACTPEEETVEADPNAETFPDVSVPEGEGYHLLGSSGAMPAGLASELFEAGGTPKADALTTASFNGNASEYVWLAHAKSFNFDSSAYRTANNIAENEELSDVF